MSASGTWLIQSPRCLTRSRPASSSGPSRTSPGCQTRRRRSVRGSGETPCAIRRSKPRRRPCGLPSRSSFRAVRPASAAARLRRGILRLSQTRLVYLAEACRRRAKDGGPDLSQMEPTDQLDAPNRRFPEGCVQVHAFQACSFNHSDISPLLESTICERPDRDSRTRRRLPEPLLDLVCIAWFEGWPGHPVCRIVSDLSKRRDHLRRFR